MTPEDSVDVLLRWCDAHGLVVDERLRVVRGDEGDIAVFSATDTVIERGTTLVTIPKTSILSIKSCALSNLIEPVIYGREAQLGLALGLYGELLKENASLWAGYLYSLPDKVDLACFWSDGDEDARTAREWIRGTMAERELRGRQSSSRSAAKNPSRADEFSIEDEVRRYYNVVVEPVLVKAGLGSCSSLYGYKYAFSLVSSRAFFVDTYHGLAMVPIADAFNHCLENQVHLESDYDVCPICGSLMECPHDTEDGVDGSEQHEKENAQLRVRRHVFSADTIVSTQSDAQNTCEMVTNAPIAPFAEVWNTYGETLTNAQLLVRYGFLLDSNENDIIAWDPRDLRPFASGVLGEVEDGIRNSDIPREEDSAGSIYDSHAPSRRARSLRYQSLDDISERRVYGIKEASSPSKPGKKDDHRLLCAPGSPTSRPQQATPVRNCGSVSTTLNGGNEKVQGLLEQLDEVISQWCCGDSDIWKTSNLVYDPYHRDGNANQHRPLSPHHRRRKEAEGYRSKNAGPELPGNDVHPLGSMVCGRGISDSENPDGGPALEARMYEDVAQDIRQGYEGPECLFALNDDAKISHHLWLLCLLIALDQFAERSSQPVAEEVVTYESMGKYYSIGTSSDVETEEKRYRDVSEGPRSSNALASGNAQKLQMKAKSRLDPQLPCLSEPKSRNHTNDGCRKVDLSLVRRIARAQVKLEELCEALPLEEEEDNDSEFSGPSRANIVPRRRSQEGFTGKRMGSPELEVQGNDGMRVRTGYRSLLDDNSRVMKHTQYESAINAINRYGDREDEEGADEELVPEQDVTIRNYENTNENAMPAADAKISAIAHERRVSLRDRTHDKRLPTLGGIAGSVSDIAQDDDSSNSSASRMRKRRRCVSPTPAPVSPSNRLHLNEDEYGMAGAAVSEEEAGEIFTESTPSPSEQVVRRHDGRDANTLSHRTSSDPSAGAQVSHAINRDRAREDLAPPPSPQQHASCSIHLGEGADDERARALASCAVSSERDYGGGDVAVVASDLNGAFINYGRDNDGDFRVGIGLGTGNSVSDMGSGSDERFIPVAFGVQLGSGLDVDWREHVGSDDGHGPAQKPDANLVRVSDPGVAVRPNEEILHDGGAETSPDALSFPAGACTNEMHLIVSRPVDGSAGEPIPVDGSLAYVDVVASIAEVVTALCADRVKAMWDPGSDAKSLGELADGIPAEKAQTRLAMQLALAERSLLESWGAAWGEFGRNLETLRVRASQAR